MIHQELKYKRSIFYPLLLIVLLFTISITFGNFFEWYFINKVDALLQLNELLSNYISLLGIGLAILAVLFAIIQLAYKQLSIITLLIEESFFLPVFYYGMLNILLCSMLTTFQYGNPANYLYIRMVITESYLFWLLTPALAMVFFRTVKLSNFSLITDLYLKKIYNMAVREKIHKTKNEFRQDLQSFGLEISEEISRLINENRIILLNRFFDFYLSVIKLNHNSNLLEGLHDGMHRWFVQSYKLPHKDVFRNLISTWWNFYDDLLKQGSADKARFLSTLPLNLYNEYRKTKDADMKFIAIQVFPIRLKEIALANLYEMTKTRKEFDKAFERIQITLSIFPELIKVAIDEDDHESTNKIFTQVRLFLSSIEFYQEGIENKFRLEPNSITTEDKMVKDVLDKISEYVNSIYLMAYAWILYKKDTK